MASLREIHSYWCYSMGREVATARSKRKTDQSRYCWWLSWHFECTAVLPILDVGQRLTMQCESKTSAYNIDNREIWLIFEPRCQIPCCLVREPEYPIRNTSHEYVVSTLSATAPLVRQANKHVTTPCHNVRSLSLLTTRRELGAYDTTMVWEVILDNVASF